MKKNAVKYGLTIVLFVTAILFGETGKDQPVIGKSYALLINGAGPYATTSGDIKEQKVFWNDMSAMYSTLINNYSYSKENIIIHYTGALGDDLDGDGIAEECLESYKENIEATFAHLQEIMTPDDQLYIYLGGHGYFLGSLTPLNSIFQVPLEGDLLHHDVIHDYEFTEYVEQINCSQMIINFGFCYSGGFRSKLTANVDNTLCKNVSIHNASSNEMAMFEYWITRDSDTREIRHVEYYYYWIAAARGYFPLIGIPWIADSKIDEFDFDPYFGVGSHPYAYNPDKNLDGYVQMGELFEYTDNFNTYSKNENNIIIIRGSYANYFNPHPDNSSTIVDFEDPQQYYSNDFIKYNLGLSGICGNVDLRLTDTGDIINEVTASGELRVCPQLTIKPGVDLVYTGNSSMRFVSNGSDIPDGVRLTLESDSKFIIDEASLVFESGSKMKISENATLEVLGVSSITGSVVTNSTSIIRIENDSELRLLTGSDLFLADGAIIEIGVNSKLIIENGANFCAEHGSVINLSEGSEFIVEEGITVNLEEGSNICINGEAKMTGNFGQSYCNLVINTDSKLHFTSGSHMNISARPAHETNLQLYENAELILDDDCELTFDEFWRISVGANSKITVGQNSIFAADGLWYPYQEKSKIIADNIWLGIEAGAGSTITISDSEISNAEVLVWGYPEYCTIENNIVNDCTDVLSLFNCNDYVIRGNEFNGTGTGSAISLYQSSGEISSNNINNYDTGLNIVSSSPSVVRNRITNNTSYGILASGYNSYTWLTDKNNIFNNGLAQVSFYDVSRVYLSNGHNNIYTTEMVLNDVGELVPAVPCIQIIATGALTPRGGGIPISAKPLVLNAELNYWGSSLVNNQFFDEIPKFRIDYKPFDTQMNTNDILPMSTESTLLTEAIKFEENGDYSTAQSKYELLISKYPDSPESYVSLSKLPSNYKKQDKDLSTLIDDYSKKLNDTKNWLNKSFIQEMIVSASIMDNKCSEAIALSEKMKTDAVSEAEKDLCDLDILIAECLSRFGSKNTSNNRQLLTEQINKIGKSGNDQTDITENVLPTSHALYQNYPNPFNPTTEIKYALSCQGNVKIVVYNTNGETVADLVNVTQAAGIHSVSFDASKLSNGVFYYTLIVNSTVIDAKKMVLIK